MSRKVDKYYQYHEEEQDDGSIAFGWILADSIDKSKDYVLSYPSRSKKISEKDLEWSNSEGCTATSLSDYEIYIERLIEQKPQDFLLKWSDKIAEFSLPNENWREGSGEFILNLCELVLGKRESFTFFGRIFKRVRDDG